MGQMPAEKLNGIGMHDFFTIDFWKSPFFKNGVQEIYLANGSDFFGGLLMSKSSVEIRTDDRMIRVAGDLANVFNLIGDIVEGNPRFVGCRFSSLPVWDQHQGI